MLRARTDPIRSLRPTFLEMGKDCCVILERTWGMEVMLNPIDEARTAVDTKRIAGKEIRDCPNPRNSAFYPDESRLRSHRRPCPNGCFT